jgi:hypothetical protein
MSVPRKYGLQTYIGAGVILMGLGFVAAQWLAPPASTANSTQAAASRPTPRIIEINTKREDFKRDDVKQAEPVKPLERAAAPAPPAPQFAEPGPPPVSAAELKRKAQEEADQTAEMPQEAVNPPPKRTPSRQRYPKYDRNAVY